MEKRFTYPRITFGSGFAVTASFHSQIDVGYFIPGVGRAFLGFMGNDLMRICQTLSFISGVEAWKPWALCYFRLRISNSRMP